MIARTFRFSEQQYSNKFAMVFDAKEYVRFLLLATDRARVIYNQLRASLSVSDFQFCELRGDAYSFRVMFKCANGKYPDLAGVSISTCKITEWSDPDTTVIETCLVGADGDLTYIDELGYSDVRLHADIGELTKAMQCLQRGEEVP